jgi:hypothetical protein
MIVGFAVLVAIGLSFMVGSIVLMNRVDSSRRASIGANGVVTQGVVVDREALPKRRVELTIDYRVGGRALEGGIHCSSSGCEQVGAKVTITVERRHLDQFVTADGRYAINSPPAATFLLGFAAILCCVVGLGGLEYQRAVRRGDRERGPQADGAPVPAGRRPRGHETHVVTRSRRGAPPTS